MAIRLPLFRPELDPVDRIEVPTPCTVPWDSMYGDERTRHCGSCRKNVYNVAELTRAQAMELIASQEPVCVRIYRRPDGTVVTSDCWSRLRAARRRGMWAFLAMLVIVGWAQLAAMVVGLAGLRRVLHPTMGEPRAAPITLVPPLPPLPEVPADDRRYIKGRIKAPYVDPRLEKKPPRRHKQPKRVDDEDSAVQISAGLMRLD